MSKNTSNRLVPISIGLVMLGFGVHQVLESKKWRSYVPKIVSDIVPLKPEVIVTAHGSGNIILGLMYIFFNKYAFSRWVATAWWFNVMLLCGRHSKKEGLRDLPIFITSFWYALKRR
ncbi:MAG: hypothetical protein JWO54_480 [Candidatus Saccharibacteria bacterium]|nr:hypothetical protein [Candidatus Saccharibacteria bacterium]MDB5180720.1 hypothetical protein [Candidatus Saccharibacteria bacterium]